MLEEEELAIHPALDAPNIQPLPAIQAPVEPNGRLNEAPVVIQRGIPDREEERHQLRPFRDRRGIPPIPQLLRAEDVERIQNLPDVGTPPAQTPSTEAAPPILETSSRTNKGKAKEGEEGDIDVEETFGLRPRTPKILDSGMNDDDDDDLFEVASDSLASTSPTAFEFTFRAPLLPSSSNHDAGENASESLSHSLTDAAASASQTVKYQYAFHPALPSPVFSSASLSPIASPGPADVVNVREEGISPNQEEFVAGSSSAPIDATDGKKSMNEDFQDEFDHYFRDAGGDSSSEDEVSSPASEREPVPDIPEALVGAPPAEEEEDENAAGDRDLWDADDGDGDDDEVELVNPNPMNRLEVQPQQVPGAPERINEGGDDMEAGVEDDMEGALEGSCFAFSMEVFR